MFVLLSKLIPQVIYPLGLACLLLVVSLVARKRPRVWQTSTLIALALLWLGGNSWVATALSKSLEWQYLPRDEVPAADMIVLLGGGTSPSQYPRQMVELNSAGDRVFYAGWLYHQGAAPRLLLSGGNIGWLGEPDSTPASEMAAILSLLEVPQEALVLETRSRNTYENVIYTTEILEQEGIDQVVLITSALHMPRAVALFEASGLEVIPAPTDYNVTQDEWQRLWEPDLVTQIYNFLPSASNLSTTTTALKEYLGFLVYHLRGWL